MNRSLIQGLVLGGIAVTAISALGAYKVVENRSAEARVLSVKAVTKSVRTPREACRDETVTHRAPVKDTNRVTGTVVGALIGGVVGHQIGGSTGKTVATVAGAAAGGYGGNQVQKSLQQGDTYQAQERHCTTVYDTVEQPDGYLVRYKLGARKGVVHMDHDPGDRIPVKDGRLLTGPLHHDVQTTAAN